MLSKPDDQNEEGCVAERSVMTSRNETSSMEELSKLLRSASFTLQPPVSTETGRQHKKRSNKQLALTQKSCHRPQTIIQQVSNSSNTTTSTMNELKTNLVEDDDDIIFLGQSTIQSLTNTRQQHLSQNTTSQHSHTHKLGAAQLSHTHTLEDNCTSSSYSKRLPTKRRLPLKLGKSKTKVLYTESKPSESVSLQLHSTGDTNSYQTGTESQEKLTSSGNGSDETGLDKLIKNKWKRRESYIDVTLNAYTSA